MAAAHRKTSDRAAFASRFAAEIRQLALDLESMQHALGDLLESRAPGVPLQRLQALDELTQRASALAKVAADLSGNHWMTAGAIERAMSRVTLGDLMQRLSGADEVSPGHDGEMELF